MNLCELGLAETVTPKIPLRKQPGAGMRAVTDQGVKRRLHELLSPVSLNAKC